MFIQSITQDIDRKILDTGCCLTLLQIMYRVMYVNQVSFHVEMAVIKIYMHFHIFFTVRIEKPFKKLNFNTEHKKVCFISCTPDVELSGYILKSLTVCPGSFVGSETQPIPACFYLFCYSNLDDTASQFLMLIYLYFAFINYVICSYFSSSIM